MTTECMKYLPLDVKQPTASLCILLETCPVNITFTTFSKPHGHAHCNVEKILYRNRPLCHRLLY